MKIHLANIDCEESLKIIDETEAIFAIQEIIDTHWNYEGSISMLNETERFFVFVENVGREEQRLGSQTSCSE